MKPIKFIRAGISGVSVAAVTNVGAASGVPYRWNATLTINAQSHSDQTSTPTPGQYDGRNVLVGDYIVSDADGKALKVQAITTATANQVVCTLEDTSSYNALKDDTGNLDGMIQSGAGIGAYIFEVHNGVPILSSIPAALPGNLLGTQFAMNLLARFNSEFNVGIDLTTGKLPSSLLPAASTTSVGAVKADPTGIFAIGGDGTLSLKSGLSIAQLGVTDVYTKAQVDAAISGAAAPSGLDGNTTVIKQKNSSVAANVPTAAELAAGVLSVNTADGKLYVRKGATVVAVTNDADLHNNAAFTGTTTFGGGMVIKTLGEGVLNFGALIAGVNALDLSIAGVITASIAASGSLTFNNIPSFANAASGNAFGFTLITVNDATAGRALAFPASVKWSGGSIPPRTTSANAKDEWYFYTLDGGVTWSGSLSNQDVK
jgi:hypothetical protein